MKKWAKYIIVWVSVLLNLWILQILFPWIYSSITNIFLEECDDLKGSDIKVLNNYFSVESNKWNYKYWCNLVEINTHHYISWSNTLNKVSLKNWSKIPSEIWKLINLKHIELTHQNIIGTMPKEIWTLKKLEILHLAHNNLTWEIPTELFSLKNLKEVWLSNNSLSGEIPKEIWNLINLENLYLSGNKLTWVIPMELLSLQKLINLDLRNNNFDWDVPRITGRR